jgi:hypothetical protein
MVNVDEHFIGPIGIWPGAPVASTQRSDNLSPGDLRIQHPKLTCIASSTRNGEQIGRAALVNGLYQLVLELAPMHHFQKGRA